MTFNKTSFEKIYRNEHDAKTKERILLVLNVLYNDIIPAQAAKDLRRSRSWASDWLKRYQKEGIEGLKDRTKSGRPTEIPEEISLSIKEELSNSKQGWTTKQVEELIIKKVVSNITILISTVSFENGDLNKRCQEKYMLILHLWKKRMLSKKDRTNTCG
ncbi:MAG TPA: helix-turn-helix domain-containing protein [Candidatus Nitrosocosmicus sp.]